MKKIKIDTDSFIFALENHFDSISSYLNKETGEVIEIIDEDSIFELDGENPPDFDENPDKYEYIVPLESSESFEIIEDFVLSNGEEILLPQLMKN